VEQLNPEAQKGLDESAVYIRTIEGLIQGARTVKGTVAGKGLTMEKLLKDESLQSLRILRDLAAKSYPNSLRLKQELEDLLDGKLEAAKP
jgi:hypothetical protein